MGSDRANFKLRRGMNEVVVCEILVGQSGGDGEGPRDSTTCVVFGR